MSPRALDMLTHTRTHTPPSTHAHSIQTRTKLQYDDVVEFDFCQATASLAKEDRIIHCVVIHTEYLSLTHTHQHSHVHQAHMYIYAVQ